MRPLILAALLTVACGAGTEPEHCSTQPACLANPQGQFRSLTPHGIVLVPCACEVKP